MISPVASTSEVTSGADTTAGSMLRRFANSGMVEPMTAPRCLRVRESTPPITPDHGNSHHE
jgi:hypothetical protein